jgi:hypothetical protein
MFKNIFTGKNCFLFPLKFNGISEVHVASFFRVEDYAKQETSMKQAARKSYIPEDRILHNYRGEDPKSFTIKFLYFHNV